MANMLAIVGQSGEGKSHSISTLNPKETYVINVLNKRLPFRGSGAAYSEENKNMASVDDWESVVNIINAVSEKRPEIKNIILDDVGFIMQIEYFKSAQVKGFEKFVSMAQHMFEIINTSRSLRDDLNVTFMFHVENVVSNGVVVDKKIKTIGSMIDKAYEPQAIFSVCLYTDVSFGEDGKTEYGFITNSTPEYPAKSPEGMFEETKIPNDLNYVVNKMNEFYG